MIFSWGWFGFVAGLQIVSYSADINKFKDGLKPVVWNTIF